MALVTASDDVVVVLSDVVDVQLELELERENLVVTVCVYMVDSSAPCPPIPKLVSTLSATSGHVTCLTFAVMRHGNLLVCLFACTRLAFFPTKPLYSKSTTWYKPRSEGGLQPAWFVMSSMLSAQVATARS